MTALKGTTDRLLDAESATKLLGVRPSQSAIAAALANCIGSKSGG